MRTKKQRTTFLLQTKGKKLKKTTEKRQKIVKIHSWEVGCYGDVNHHRHVIDTGKYSLINFRKSHEIWWLFGQPFKSYSSLKSQSAHVCSLCQCVRRIDFKEVLSSSTPSKRLRNILSSSIVGSLLFVDFISLWFRFLLYIFLYTFLLCSLSLVSLLSILYILYQL